MFSASEIRKSFLDYFSRQGHHIVPSAPLIPKDDPSLLFTNAGMVQFKKVFLGQEKRSYTKAASSQKCLRVGGKHNDLENVGRTRRHHTFFEMLGNFSFGDYFKEQAIALAWEYLTQELGLTKERLYVSVYQEDDEAEKLWTQVTDVPRERIYRLGADENFWAMGDTGPCGPCSEILYDQGLHMACGAECEIGVCDCDRYLEIWNLVFMQFNRDESGEMTPLPRPSIDTGMGLERIAAVCQGVYSNFDTDLFSGLIQSMAYKAGVQYGTSNDIDTALRVIADHSRAIPFMIADGILPSNESRGYVLRRIIRRAYRFGSFIGMQGPFLHQLCGQLVNEMGQAYPELVEARDFVSKVVFREEENFSKTLDKGLGMLEESLRDMHKKGQTLVDGETVFKLYDTFGFPIDIVKDIAEKRGFQVDESGFDQFMKAQKERSKAAWAGSGEVDLAEKFANYLESGLQTEFSGYERSEDTSRIIVLLDMKGNSLEKAEEGSQIYIVTARTPFYGESGGQVGDKGKIFAQQGTADVEDTIKPSPEFVVHQVRVIKGRITKDEEVRLQVEPSLRMAAARNHTCTHLLHTALRKVLGEHVKQSGSLVSPDRLRFDFTHINPLSEQELQQVEDEVNRAILADIELRVRVVDFEQAKKEEAVGLFAEKYEDKVRVVEIPEVSKELCGGIHLQSTGQAGSFFIISDTGVAAGVRRIEAATGWKSIELYRNQKSIIHNISSLLRTRPEKIHQKVEDLQNQLKNTVKEKEQLEAKLAFSSQSNISDQAEVIDGIKLLATKVDLPEGSGMKGLRKVMDDLRSEFASGIILLAAQNEGKAMLILHVSRDLHSKFTAPGLIKEVAKEVSGSGGGRPDLAQAGGNDPAGIPRALTRVKELISQ